MKILLLCTLCVLGALPLNGKVYYVDSENGLDQNSGTSPSSTDVNIGPWKTISKVNSMFFEAGDSILFKRGASWMDGPLDPNNGGQAQGTVRIEETILSDSLTFHLVDPNDHQCIYFGAYGEGSKPRIDCQVSDVGIILRHNYIIVENIHLDNGDNDVLQFNGVNGNYWILIKNVDLTRIKANAVRFRNGGGNCWLDGIYIYDYGVNGIYLEGSDSNALDSVLVENCWVEKPEIIEREDGISCHADEDGNNIAGNVIIRNNTIIRSGEDGIDITSGSNILVEGNVIRHSSSAGIHAAKKRVHTVEIRGNVLDSNSISRGLGDLSIICSNVRAVNNFILGSGHHSIYLKDASHVSIWNNVVSPVDRSGNLIWLRSGLDSIEFKNNIFDFTRSKQEIEGDLSSTFFDHNCYYVKDSSQSVLFDFSFEEARLQDSAFEMHGVRANPLFVDNRRQSPEHFQLDAESPCLDAGVSVALTFDFLKSARPQGEGIEIGPYEVDPCPDDLENDIDNDGICGSMDNCPTISNRDQKDNDGDGMGNACDLCPWDKDNDVDGDGVCGDLDNCRTKPNADQMDADGNGIGDVCNDRSPVVNNAIKPFPNPFEDEFNLEIGTEIEAELLQIRDFNGKLILSSILDPNQKLVHVQVAKLSQGLYSVIVIARDGTTLVSKISKH